MPTLELKESLPIGVELRFNNIYTESGNGAKTAYVHWDQPLLKFDLSRAIPETYESIKTYLIDFFKEVKGTETIFRYSDPTDNYVTATIKTGFATDKSWGIGVKNSDGSQYQLFKVYELEGVRSYRPITKPVNNINFKIFNGTTQITTGFTVNYVTGVITFSPAQPSLNLLWQGNFDVPCRFSSDAIAFITEVAAKEECNHALYSIPSFEILEVRETAIAHPTAPVLPERIKHEFALDVNVKEQDELTLNTSITVFDSGFEVRQSNYLETVSNQLQPKIFRKFTTGEITKGDDIDLHYMLCLWRCTRGGAIVFQHHEYEVQARETFNIDVQLEEADKILYPNCKRYPVYDIGSLQLVESSVNPALYLIPPYNFNLTTLFIDPQNSSDPVIAASNPTNGGNFGSSSGGSNNNNSESYNLATYQGSVGLASPPPGSNNAQDWRASAMFWAAGAFWLIVTSDKSGTVATNPWYHRSALYRLDGTNFTYVESNLKNYVITYLDISAQNKRSILKTPTGISLFVRANNGNSFGVSGNPANFGLLRFEIQNDGSFLTDFVSESSITPLFGSAYTIGEGAVAVFGDIVLSHSSSTTNVYWGQSNGLKYYFGNFRPTKPNGFPVGSDATNSALKINTFPANFYTIKDNQVQKTLYKNSQEIASHFVSSTSQADFIDFRKTKQNQEGAIFARLSLPFECNNNLQSCTNASATNQQLIYLIDEYFNDPILLNKMPFVSSSDANPQWLNAIISNNITPINHDKFGNSLIKYVSDIYYYQSGSGNAIKITNQFSSPGNIRCNDCVSPYGFAMFSSGFNLFQAGTNPQLIIIQPQIP